MKIIYIFILVALFSCSDHNQSTKVGRETIKTDKAPPAIGPYSQAIKVGNRIYVAGQIGLTTNRKLVEGIENQTHQTLKNIKAILEAGGFSLNHVVQAQVFLQSIDDYKTVNDIYSEYFSESKPARAAIEVSKIPAGALIEIMVVAEK